MHRGVAVDFAGRCLQHLDLQPLGKTKHVDGADDAGLGGLHRILLVVNWRCWAGEIKDLVDLDKKRVGDVVAQELKPLVIEQMLDVVPCSGKEVVDAQNLAPELQQAFAKMRAEKSGATANQNASVRDAALFPSGARSELSNV